MVYLQETLTFLYATSEYAVALTRPPSPAHLDAPPGPVVIGSTGVKHLRRGIPCRTCLRLLEPGDRRLVVGFSIQELFTRPLNGTAVAVPWLPSPSAAQASSMQYTAGSWSAERFPGEE